MAARDTLELEGVQLDTICEGKLWDEYHEIQERILSTMPKPEDDPERAFYDPTKAREVTIKVTFEPKDGGVGVGYAISSKIPTKKRTRGGFAQMDRQGKLVQFAARQGRIPGTVAAEGERKVFPINKASASGDGQQ